MRDHCTIGNRRVGYLTAESAVKAPDRPQRTLVLVHAFPLTADMWEPQVAALPQGWRLIAPDLRGFGQSSMGGEKAQGMSDHAGDLVDLLDALHVHDAVFGGLSMGGYVVFALLRNAPRYIAGLLLASTRAEADSEQGRAARQRMLELIDRQGAAGVADDLLPKLLAPSTREQRPDVVARVRALMLGHPPEVLKRAVIAMMERPDSTDALRTIHCPTLIVTGADDALIPVTASEVMQRAIPGAALDVIPQAGHLSSLEQPEAFNASLRRFLERI